MENFKVRKLVDKFFREEAPKIVLYNEAGLQHELAIYLRKSVCDVRLEYPITSLDPMVDVKPIKKEIDIFVINKKEKVLIELKFPRTKAGMPLEIYRAVEDVRFGEEAIEHGKVNAFISVFMTDHRSITIGKNPNHLYRYFNHINKIKSINNDNVALPKFMKGIRDIILKKDYIIEWKWLDNNGEKYKYYIVTN